MSNRAKFLTVGLAAVLVAAALVAWAMAQGAGERPTTTATLPQAFRYRSATAERGYPPKTSPIFLRAFLVLTSPAPGPPAARASG